MNKSLIIPFVVLLTFACSGEQEGKSEATASAEPGAAAPATSTADALASLPEPSRAPFGAMMAGYGTIQTALSSDTTAGVDVAASAVAGAARVLESTATGPAKAQYGAIATEAANVASSASDLVKTRQAFGELSKAVLSLLVANPDLAKGRVVVECPMTSTYKKWLQTDEKVRNPYYGSTMLECGTVSKLEL
jgi:Cu(I)/Ag(I) efflux system membrane fusion protein